MPVEGFKSVTISKETYKELGKIAEKTHRSIPEVIEFLLETARGLERLDR